MRPWMGAVAVATALLAVPGAALAGEHDPALIQFKLPSKTEVHVLESMGLSLDHAIDQASDGSALASAWVTDAEKALVEARGYPAVKTIHDRHNIDRLRAEREQAIDDEQAAKSALKMVHVWIRLNVRRVATSRSRSEPHRRTA